ncbi:MAG: hypothetical protein JWQ14_692 [Adhaeribacter sp.]|nr:hypothetical protein [Adhaeribacter sp.]
MKSSVLRIGNPELELICEKIQVYSQDPGKTMLIPGLILRANVNCEEILVALKEEINRLNS